MSAATAVTQSNVADALQRALKDQAEEKGDKWGANGEAAATSGVIQFLQKYMRDDAKILKDVKAGGKMKGAAAQLALTAIEFATRCGGVELSFGGKVTVDDDAGDDKKSDVERWQAGQTYSKSKVRAHDRALNETLLDGEQMWGRIKYLEEYKLKYYYEDEIKKLEATRVAYDGDNEGIKQMLQQSVDDRKNADERYIKSDKNQLSTWKAKRQAAERKLLKDKDGDVVLAPKGSNNTIPLAKDIVMIDEKRKEFYDARISPVQDEVVSNDDDAAAPVPADDKETQRHPFDEPGEGSSSPKRKAGRAPPAPAKKQKKHTDKD